MKKKNLIATIASIALLASSGAAVAGSYFYGQKQVNLAQVYAEEATYEATFTSRAWGTSGNDWESGKAGAGFSNDGVQITTGASGANATSKKEFSNVSQVVVTYCTNASKGVGSIAVKIGSNTAHSQSVTKSGGTTHRDLTFNISPSESGKVNIAATCTTNSIYVVGVKIVYNEVAAAHEITLTDSEGHTSGSVEAGDSLSLTALVDGEAPTSSLTWSSSSPSVATVSDGNVTTLTPGSTTISVSTTIDGETFKAEYVLNVSAPVLPSGVHEDGKGMTGYFYDASSFDDTTGTPATESAVLTGMGDSSKAYISSVSDISSAATSKSGGLTLGTSSKTGSFTFNMSEGHEVTSVLLWGAKYDSGTFTVNGESAESGSLGEKKSEADYSLSPLTWNFAGEESLTFETTSGRATIYRIDLYWSEEATDPVESVTLTGIENGSTLYKGDKIKLTATASPSTASQRFTFSSSNESIATVDSNGNVEVLDVSDELITITATSKADTTKKASLSFYASVRTTPISSLRNASGTGANSTYNNKAVTYKGTIVGIMADGSNLYDLYIQEGEKAICAYKCDGDQVSSLKVGDGVLVTGTLTYYNGMLETKDNTVSAFPSAKEEIVPLEITVSNWTNRGDDCRLVSASDLTYVSGKVTLNSQSELHFHLKDDTTQDIYVFVKAASATAEFMNKIGCLDDGTLDPTKSYSLQAIKVEYTKNGSTTNEVYIVDGSSLYTSDDEAKLDEWVATYITAKDTDYESVPEADRNQSCKDKYDAAMASYNDDTVLSAAARNLFETGEKYAEARATLAFWKAAAYPDAPSLSLGGLKPMSLLPLVAILGGGLVAGSALLITHKRKQK